MNLNIIIYGINSFFWLLAGVLVLLFYNSDTTHNKEEKSGIFWGFLLICGFQLLGWLIEITSLALFPVTPASVSSIIGLFSLLIQLLFLGSLAFAFYQIEEILSLKPKMKFWVIFLVLAGLNLVIPIFGFLLNMIIQSVILSGLIFNIIILITELGFILVGMNVLSLLKKNSILKTSKNLLVLGFSIWLIIGPIVIIIYNIVNSALFVVTFSSNSIPVIPYIINAIVLSLGNLILTAGLGITIYSLFKLKIPKDPTTNTFSHEETNY